MNSNSPKRHSISMHPVHVKRRQRGLAVIIATLIVLIGATIYIAVERSNVRNPGDFEGDGNGVVEMVEIEPGSSVSAVGPELEQRGIVKSNAAFQSAAANEPKAAQLPPGVYRLQQQMSAAAAVAAFVNPANRVQSLDIANGATLIDVRVVGGSVRPGIFSQIHDVMCAQSTDNCFSVDELEDVAANVDPAELGAPQWALDKVRAQGANPRRLEGLIEPGEYVLSPNSTAQEVLTQLLTASTKSYNETNILERAQTIGLTPYELLTAASLVEREAPAGDFDKVARVILNRLDEDMQLEFDSTVNYDLEDQEVATTDEDRARETPWNTYAKVGLPDTPIASPSLDAIKAMENPADGDWLFFVTVDQKGTTEFNRTFEEHQQDMQKSIDNGVLDSNR